MTREQINKLVEERTIKEATYIVEHQATIRETAKIFSIAKSQLHRDVTERLQELDYRLYIEVRNLLDVNKEDKGRSARQFKNISFA